MLSPDKLEGTETMRGIDVSDSSNTDHWRGLNDGYCLYNFLFVYLCKIKRISLVSDQLIV